MHDDCMDSLADAGACDLGEFRGLIIPPHYLHRVNKLRRRHPDEFAKVTSLSPSQSLAGAEEKMLSVFLSPPCSWGRPAAATAGLRCWCWPTRAAGTTWARLCWGSFAPSSTRCRSESERLLCVQAPPPSSDRRRSVLSRCSTCLSWLRPKLSSCAPSCPPAACGCWCAEETAPWAGFWTPLMR